MNKIKLILGTLILLVSYTETKAQFGCASQRRNNLNISTAVGNSTRWRIINNPPSYPEPPATSLLPVPFIPFILTNGNGNPALFTTPNDNPVNRTITNGSGNFKDRVPYIFERQFCVSQDNTNVTFNFSFSADDYVQLSLINLNTNLPVLGFNSIYDLSTDTPPFTPSVLNNTFNLNYGTYAIRASVIDFGGIGINFWLNGNINSNSGLRLIETDAGFNCCNRINTLVVSKVIDNNSNGIIDANDVVSNNWNFNINPNTNSLPPQSSAISDLYGNVFFNNVNLGTSYSISETSQPGFIVQPNQIWTINNQINQRTFVNRKLPCDTTICCNGVNLIRNPFFETITPTNFQSDYLQETNRNNLMPNEYIIDNISNATIICSNWIDTSRNCSNHCNVLFVNGRTTQPSTTPLASVWKQTINTQIDSSYQFCGKVKPLNNCCFNVTPKITIRVSDATGNLVNQNVSLSNSLLDNCGWYNFNFQFIARNSTTKVEILLDETVIGDGNDIAIDNIGLIKIPKISFLIGHSVAPTNPPIVTTSVAPNVTIAPNNCQFMWYVLEGELINNVYTPPPSGIPVFGRGNNNGSALNLFGSLNPLNPWTPINNTFSGFTFDRNRNYVIVFNAYNCNCAYTNLHAIEFDETTQLFRLANGKIEKVHKNILINQSIMNFIKDKQK